MIEKKCLTIKGRKVPVRKTVFGNLEVEAGTNAHVKGVPPDEWYCFFCVRKNKPVSGKKPIIFKCLLRGDPVYFPAALGFISRTLDFQILRNFSSREADICADEAGK